MQKANDRQLWWKDEHLFTTNFYMLVCRNILRPQIEFNGLQKHEIRFQDLWLGRCMVAPSVSSVARGLWLGFPGDLVVRCRAPPCTLYLFGDKQSVRYQLSGHWTCQDACARRLISCGIEMLARLRLSGKVKFLSNFCTPRWLPRKHNQNGDKLAAFAAEKHNMDKFYLPNALGLVNDLNCGRQIAFKASFDGSHVPGTTKGSFGAELSFCTKPQHGEAFVWHLLQRTANICVA